MRLDDDDLSNVEDRRGQAGSIGSGRGLTGMHLGIGGTVVVLALSVLFKRDFFSALGLNTDPGQVESPGPSRQDPGGQARVNTEEQLKHVAVASFNDAQKVWAAELPQHRVAYRPAKLVLFWDETRSACGAAGAQMGPFYCPGDERVYIDLGFYRELATRFGAPGEFAQAYVIAHEVGHHIQNLLGTEAQVRDAQRRGRNPANQNRLSVRMELQADCYAGVWAHSTDERHLLARGDIEQGLNAAAAVGDDRIQKAATGRVSPESFTHGSASQRTHWFRVGYQNGRLEECDTFAPQAP